jgi:hypothetical protein
MKAFNKLIFTALVALAPACFAQKWEVGGVTGGSFSNGLTVSNGLDTATAGLANGWALGAVLGQNLYPRISGELRYSYIFSDLQLLGSGQSASFKGATQSMHYEILLHSRATEYRVQPFAAAGGGMRIFSGVGTETLYQPLSNFALLTKTQQWMPMATFGGGIKYAITRRVRLRLEMRDYLTRFPTKVIAPAPGARLSGWLHDFVPMAGITFVF